MPSLTDPPSPRRGFSAVATVTVLAALVLAAGRGPSPVTPPEHAAGDRLATSVDGDRTTASTDAYLRRDLTRRPLQLPAAMLVAAVVVADGVRRHRRTSPGAVMASTPLLHLARGSRGPPRILLV